MQLYSLNGGYPTTLPLRLRLPDGSTRTSLQSLSAQELNDLGFVVAPAYPSYTKSTQKLVWTGSDWSILDKTEEEIFNEWSLTVPTVVSMRQARLALLQKGLLLDVESLIAGASEEVQIEWEYSKEVDRNSDVVHMLAQALELTQKELLELFEYASKI